MQTALGGGVSFIPAKGRCVMWLKMAAVAMLVFSADLMARAPVKAADDTFEGKVLGVGEDKIMLMGKTDADNRTFMVTAETKISRNGKPAKLSEIKTGDKAMVTFTGSGTNLAAKQIVVAASE
jgi:hypothetical protein